MRASQEEINAIKSAMDAEKNIRVFKRYQALYLFLSGKPELYTTISITNELFPTKENQGLMG